MEGLTWTSFWKQTKCPKAWRKREKSERALSKYMHHLIVTSLYYCWLFGLWDNGIRLLSFFLLCEKSRGVQRRGRKRKGMDGFAEDNGSTQLGHLRSVYSVLTSFSRYPMFIHSFLFGNSGVSTCKLNNLNISLCWINRFVETDTLCVNTPCQPLLTHRFFI